MRRLTGPILGEFNIGDRMGTEDIEFGTCIVGGLGKYWPEFCGNNDWENEAIIYERNEFAPKSNTLFSPLPLSAFGVFCLAKYK